MSQIKQATTVNDIENQWLSMTSAAFFYHYDMSEKNSIRCRAHIKLLPCQSSVVLKVGGL